MRRAHRRRRRRRHPARILGATALALAVVDRGVAAERADDRPVATGETQIEEL